ncbi:serine/threonine protein kinase [Streptomyces indicus]|uniref:Serine/threonine protein kinase n=1 Tax=Streptomyces indicus TaxID=417292 RepID=A0A1G8T1M0_9ACTN|nr:serine/threonine protein kinase [Streptomyces indicus]SDJ35428.1 Serine/threonine protein kinase [Streptomyces indicus]
MSWSGLRAGDPRRIGGWTLVGRLGAGGMGVVYLAHAADGAPVALKRLREDLADDAEFRARFRREAAALLRVQGACTARVLAVDVDASRPFAVMEYVPGPTLAEHVAEYGPLRGDMAHGFALGLAEALAAIHGAGVVHRDLKPGNVLLSDQGPKVIDFGIAQAADATALTRTGVAVGTVGYMAPEQLSGQAGPPADVFAWALTVAFATTGRPPFGTGPVAALLHRIEHEEPDLDGVPAHLRALLTSALSPSPEQRPSAEELLAALAGSGGGGTRVDADEVSTVLATAWQMPEPSPSPSPSPPPLPRPRRPWIAAWTSLAVLLAAMVGLLWAVLPDRGHSSESGGTASGSAPTATATSAPESPATPPSSPPETSAQPTTQDATPSSTTPAQAQPTPFSSTGALRNSHSGLCVDTNGPQRPGLNLQLRSCGNFSGQQWSYDGTGQHFTNTPSDLCLDTDGKPAAGVRAVLNPCGHYSGQLWRHDSENGRFVNTESGLCLDTNGPPAVYVDLVLRPCGHFTGQYWQM